MKILEFIQQKIAEEEGTLWFSFFAPLSFMLVFCLSGFFAFCMIKMQKTQNILYGLPVLVYFIFILWAILTGKMG